MGQMGGEGYLYFTVLLAALHVINKYFKSNWVKWVKPQKERLWLDMKTNRKLNSETGSLGQATLQKQE